MKGEIILTLIIRRNMSVGIYDMDMATYTIVPFNLEVMKLSSFFKKKHEIVSLALSFAPEKNEKFFVRKDYDDGNYPKGLLEHSNVEYGGYAFSNGLYVPMDLEIEKCKPDTSIYERMEFAFLGSKVPDRKKIFQNMLKGEHGRLSLDGKNIWENYMTQFNYLPAARDIILHDYDLSAITGSFEEVKRLLSKARTDGWATKIGMKFPVKLYTGKDLLNWSSLNPNRTFYSMEFLGLVDMESWYEYVMRTYQRGIYINLEYNITGNGMSEDYLCSEGLRSILRQVILSRSQRIHFSLKYADNFFSDARWERVIDFFQFYLSSLTNQKAAVYFKALPNDTVFDFAKHIMDTPYKTYGEKAVNREEAREIFNFIREKNYPLFKDLYECSFNSLKEEYHDLFSN